MKGRAAFVVAVTGAAMVGLVALATCAAVPRSHLSSAQSVRYGILQPTPAELRYGGGPVIFVVALSSTKMTTEQSLELTLTARSRPGWRVSFPQIGSTLGRFTVSARRISRSRLTHGDYLLQERSYVLAPFLPGDYELPPLLLTASDGKSTLDLQSRPLTVKVESLIPTAAQQGALQSAARAGGLPDTLPEVFAGAVVLLAALSATLIFLVGRWGRRHWKRPPSVAPWVRAQRELDRLVGLDLPSKGRHGEFYQKISELMRRYVEEVFAVDASEQATEEFLFAAKDSPLLGRHRRTLGEFLAHCDLVKFASCLPAEEEVHDAVTACRAFIDSSRSDLTDRASEELQEE